MIKDIKNCIEVTGAGEFLFNHLNKGEIEFLNNEFNLFCDISNIWEELINKDLTDEEIILLILDNRKENYILYYVDGYDLFIIMELD